MLGGVLTMNVVRQHGRAAWIVPSYKNGRSLWRWAQSIASPMRRYFDISKAERTISTHRGGFFGIYSADNADAIRGEWFHLVVLDEAARIAVEDWTDAIQPTLADADGDAILISTPKGSNWFWQEWQKGRARNERIASWRAPTRANPNPRIQKAAELAKTRVPDRTYRQEWLAEFVADGAVFRFVRERATATAQAGPIDGHTYVMGCDWGKVEDFTWLTIVDMMTGELAAQDRFNQIDYQVQIGRLMALYERFKPIVIMAEQNSIGMPIIEQLWRLELPVQPFVTTNASKARIVEDLLLAFERGTIQILNDEVLIGELQAFAVKKTATGLPQYSAPDGMHDDGVMSLAMAWSAAKPQEYVR